MKKSLFFGLSAMATMLFTASCQQEELVKQSQAGDLAKVSIKVTTPELGAATRAFGDGESAKVLHYAVYNVKIVDGKEELTYLPELTVEDHEMEEKKAIVDLQLVTGNTYKVIFWADNKNAPYGLYWDAKDENGALSPKMVIDYNNEDNGVTANNEDYDAFCNWMTIDVDAAKTVDIDLYRPFAQLNIGTSDIVEASQAGYTLRQTQIKVQAYTTLNFWGKGSQEGNDSEKMSRMTATDLTDVLIDFQPTDYPNYDDDVNAKYHLKDANAEGYEKFPVDGYEYMAMNYLLRSADKELADIEFLFYSTEVELKERSYASVPLQRNWRTNIYGQLITSDVDVKVEIIPGFDNAYNKEVWDGHTLTAPQVEADGTIVVGQGSDLAYIANVLNGGDQSNAANSRTRAGSEDYTKAKIVLTNNIDLGGENWNPIKGFKGVFDGNGFVISNLNVSTEGQASAGLFADLNGGTVKNLTVKDAEIKGHYKSGVIVGDGLCALIDSCEVENAKVVVTPYNNDDANHVGGIVGYLSGESVAYVKDCSVKNAEITAYRDVAGVVGTANQTAEVRGCKVENVTVTADQTSEYKEVKDSNAGAIVGRIHANAKVEDNTIVEGVEVIVKGISATDLKNLVAEENATINLGAGTYVFPGNSIASGVTINCAEGTVFEGASSLNIKGATVVGATFSNPKGSAVGGTINGTFKNCTFTGSNALRDCYAGETVVFENCVFDGVVYGVHFDGGENKEILFKNCTLSGFNAFAAAIKLVTFEDCTFKANGKSGYNGANLWGSAKMINTNFEFDGSVQNEWIDAIGADKTYEFTGCTINDASMLNGDYFFSRTVGTKATVDGVEYTRAEGGYWANNGTAMVATTKALEAALANDEVKKIYLSAGTIFEGTFKPSGDKVVSSVPTNKATIKGRVNIDNYADGISFENIKFDISDASKVKNSFTGANYKYPGIVMIYASAASFEGCEFKSDLATGVCGINYGSHAPEKVLTVNNCSFEGDFYAIRSRTLFSVTNSTFNTYTEAGKLAAIFTWGNGEAGTTGDSGANSVTFKGNKNLNENSIYGVQLTSTTFNYCNILIDVQGNTGFDKLEDSVNPACVFTGTTFAEGSETF